MTDTVAPDTLEALRSLDTPTVCNALELVAPERRGNGYTVEHLHCVRPELGRMLGFAKTVRIAAERPDGKTPEEKRAGLIEYFRYVASGDGPKVIIVQDIDERPGYGAFWGEVFTAVHKGFGALGVITNGSVRDLDEFAEGFQALVSKIGPSHAYVHVVDFGGDVNVVGMDVSDGDLIHADKHGAVVVPHAAAAEIPDAADLMARREAFIINAARRPDFSVDKLQEAMEQAAKTN
ncbi:MAG: RraA family protein [Pseudomonadota bacterium]